MRRARHLLFAAAIFLAGVVVGANLPNDSKDAAYTLMASELCGEWGYKPDNPRYDACVNKVMTHVRERM